MAWNIFKKDKDDKNPLEDNSLEQKINAALNNAKNDKRQAENDIQKIKSWIAEVIVETYADAFPNGNLTYYREKYKEDALQNYDKIKNENVDKVSADKAEKCDKIVAGYLNQIALRESKLKLYDKLVNEYTATKNKLKNVNLNKVSDDKISSHEDRLKQLDNDTNSYVDAVTDTNEMDELKREFELKSEYFNQLNKLNDKYDTQSDDSYDNAIAFKSEIDKILGDMD